MTSIKIDDSTIARLTELSTLFQTNTLQARRFESIHSVINVCAGMINLMRMFAAQPIVNGVSYDSNTVIRFYNETVGFILGESRPIRMEIWSGIINDIYDQTPDGLVGNNGSVQAAEKWGRLKGDNVLTAPSFGQTSIRKELLSYAHRDILHMWLLRPNGIDDMLHALTAISKIYAVHEYRPAL